LYEQLIGQDTGIGASASAGPAGEGTATRNLFILDVLGSLPAAVLRPYVPNLNEILSRLEINRTPPLYVCKLKSLIHDAAQRGGSENRNISSRFKRPAVGAAGGSPKRTR